MIACNHVIMQFENVVSLCRLLKLFMLHGIFCICFYMGDGQKVMDGFKFLKICSKKRQAKKVTFSQKYVQFCDKCLKNNKIDISQQFPWMEWLTIFQFDPYAKWGKQNMVSKIDCFPMIPTLCNYLRASKKLNFMFYSATV